MKTTYLINLFKTLLILRPGAANRRRIFCLLGLLLCAMTVTPVGATVVVNNSAGSFRDDYGNSLGIFSAPGVKVAPPGTVSLISPGTPGNYTTVEIVPTSFDQWLA